MKNIYYTVFKFAVVILTMCCSFTSCQMGTIEIKRYRDRPKDPALIGEWLYLVDLEQIKSDPKLIEENLDRDGFLAGIVFHSNGDVQAIRLHYSKNSTEPRLEREPSRKAFYTKNGLIYYIETHPKRGDYPNSYAAEYIIKGNLLCLYPINGIWDPQYEKKRVTIDIFPKRTVE